MRKVIGVDRYELLPLRRYPGFLENGVKRAGRFAGAAIDALARVDVILLVFFGRMDTVYRTDVHAGRILFADTGLSNHVGHRNCNRPFSLAGFGSVDPFDLAVGILMPFRGSVKSVSRCSRGDY